MKSFFSFNKISFTKLSFFIAIFFASYYNATSQVSEIFTDYAGYWRSSTAARNSTHPNTSHNLLAFKVGTDTFSTGVSDSTLISRGLHFTAGNYKALPITSVGGTVVGGTSLYIALAALYDGVALGYSTPLPSVRIKDVLTDGKNGLNIGTGVTNLPTTSIMTFPVQDFDLASLADAKPDILFTQIADPSASSDSIYFVNSSGVLVGNKVTVNWAAVDSLGTYTLDLYNLQSGVSCDAAIITSGFNPAAVTRTIRMTGYKLSDFGVTSANATSVVNLIIKPGGQSDPAFVAYNSDAFTIRTPVISGHPQTQIACPGTGSVTFTVTATGTSLNYQWRKNGVNITGATSSSYTINPVTSSDAGSYDVVVSNSAGSVYSSVALLNTAITTQPLPAAQTIATGNTISLSVTAANATSYQWKKDGADIAGATLSSYTTPVLTSSTGGSYTVSVINSGGSGCANLLSNAAVITPSTTLYSKSSGSLNAAASWGVVTDGSGSTPVNFTRSEHTFIIANRTTATTVADLAIAGTLDIKNAVTTIPAGTTLDVGALIRSGTGTLTGSTTSSLILRGTSNLNFTTGSQVIKNLTITGGTVTMQTPLTITANSASGKLSLTGGTFALAGNKVTLQSTSTTNTAMVTAIGSGASITYGTGGGFIVERYIPAKRAFRFISPAVTTNGTMRDNWMEGANNLNTTSGNNDPNPGYGTHITGAGGATNSFDATNTNYQSIFTYNNSTQLWSSVANATGTLVAGTPYRFMIRGSRSVNLNNNAAAPSTTILRATGALSTGTITYTSALNSTVGKYSFIGNPYASPVSWTAMTKTGLASSYYTWDESVGTRGAYVSYNSTTGLNSSAASAVDANIQSGQAFFVQTNAANPTLQFQEANKTATNTSVFRTANQIPKLAVQLLLNNDGGSVNTADGFVALFDDSFADSIGNEDSYKFTNLDENMAINRNGVTLSIEGRPGIKTTDTLPIKMWQFRQSKYLFKIDAENFDPFLTAFLHDAYLQTDSVINLAETTLIPFIISADSASFVPDRFSILFKASQTLPLTLTNLSALQKNDGVQLHWVSNNESGIAQYEVEKSIDGIQFSKVAILQANNSRSYEWFDNKAAEGINLYRINVKAQSGEGKNTNIVKVNIESGHPRLSVFPNPIVNHEIHVQINNIEKGTYAYTLYNALGQTVFSGAINHAGGSASHTIKVNNGLGKGLYNLQFKNSRTDFFTSIIIQ